MAREQVEVERTITETEDVFICDYCGLGEDDGYGDMIPFVRADDPLTVAKADGGNIIHFHEECVERGLGHIGPKPSDQSLSDYGVKRVYYGMDLSFSRLGTIFLVGAGIILGMGYHHAVAILVALGLVIISLLFFTTVAAVTEERANIPLHKF